MNTAWSELSHVAPHRGAHRVALRAGLGILIPLTVLETIGHAEWSLYAVMGAFVSLYGREASHRQRLQMQLSAGVSLVAAVVAGVAVSAIALSPLLVIALAGGVAAVGASASATMRWHPPGPLFIVFAFTACAAAPASPNRVLIAAFTTIGSVVLGIAIGAAEQPRSRRACASRQAATPGPDVVHNLRRLILQYTIAAVIAGSLAYLAGWTHAFWAITAAMVPLSASNTNLRLVRAGHRLIGTAVGIAVAAALLSWYPSGIVLIGLLSALQAGAELLIGRNYALALICITPLALLMGQLSQVQPAGPLLLERGAETLLGVVVAVMVLLLVRDVPKRSRI